MLKLTDLVVRLLHQIDNRSFSVQFGIANMVPTATYREKEILSARSIAYMRKRRRRRSVFDVVFGGVNWGLDDGIEKVSGL